MSYVSYLNERHEIELAPGVPVGGKINCCCGRTLNFMRCSGLIVCACRRSYRRAIFATKFKAGDFQSVLQTATDLRRSSEELVRHLERMLGVTVEDFTVESVLHRSTAIGKRRFKITAEVEI